MKYEMSFKCIATGLVSLMLSISFGLNFVYAQPDCDDTNSAVHPGATEVPMNGIDDDCNPLTLDSAPETDDDGDGYSEDQGDCDDTNPAVNPGVTEVPNNGIDDDCDPLTLDGSAEHHTYDTNQDWMIGNFELLHAIDIWANGNLGNFELLHLIDFWAAGCYHWDVSLVKYNMGCL